MQIINAFIFQFTDRTFLDYCSLQTIIEENFLKSHHYDIMFIFMGSSDIAAEVVLIHTHGRRHETL